MPAVEPRLLVGVGNESRGDDGVGLRVARRCRELMGRSGGGRRAVRESDGDVGRLLQLLGSAEDVVVVDASEAAGRPGRVTMWTAPPPASSVGGGGSHGLGVAEAIQLAAALGALPASLVVYGIEAASVELGRGLSPVVAAAAERLARDLASESTSRRRRGEPPCA